MLLHELGKGWDNNHNNREDDTWRTVFRRGFHPVFDAGIKRLILVVVSNGSKVEDEDDDDSRTKIGLYLVELWDALMPHYA